MLPFLMTFNSEFISQSDNLSSGSKKRVSFLLSSGEDQEVPGSGGRKGPHHAKQMPGKLITSILKTVRPVVSNMHKLG